MSKITLNIGEHWSFRESNTTLKILSGIMDVFALSELHEDQIFLFQAQEGDYIFPLQDELGEIELIGIAREQIQTEVYEKQDLPFLLLNQRTDLCQGMAHLLRKLTDLPWIHYFVLRNDEYVGQWPEGKFIYQTPTEELLPLFKEHLGILSTLCFGQFAARKKHFDTRLRNQQAERQLRIDRSIELLTGLRPQRKQSLTSQSSLRTGYIRLTEQVVSFFHMEQTIFGVPDYIEKNPDDWNYLKFLLNKNGLRWRKVLLTQNCFTKDSGVFLVQQNNVWCLALPENANTYYLNTGDGARHPLSSEEAALLAPEAYQLYASLPNRKLSIQEFLNFLAQQWLKIDLWTILCTSIILGLIPILIPLITETVFNDVVPIHDYRTLTTITQVLLISGFTTAILTAVRSIAVNRITAHLNIDSDSLIWSRLLALPTSFFKQYSVGELVQRLLSAKQITNLLNGNLVSGLFNALFSFWSLGIMLYYSSKLTLICLCIWAVYLLLTWLIYHNYPAIQRESIQANNVSSSRVVQIFSGLNKFRSRGGEEEAFMIWSHVFSLIWKQSLKLRWLNNYNSLLNALLPQIILLALFWFTGTWALENTEDALNSSQFMAFTAAYSGFNTALMAMVPQVIQILNLRANLENIKPILENAPEVGKDKRDAGQLFGEIDLHHLCFAYDNGPMIIKDLSLHIRPGEKVAIVGPSGCGKSTLLRLILGFETPKTGTVAYDGKDLKELNLASVRRQLGVVMQEGKLLGGNILNNIVGSHNLTADDAWEAARKVALAKDIEEMPMGMQTVINEGSTNISGGQRQRILLARSIVNHPVILILDEATSALDNLTQSIVTDSLNAMHCTQILVAHRLSTIRQADRIIVLKDGSIAESGTFEELMQLNGLFSQLAARQLV